VAQDPAVGDPAAVVPTTAAHTAPPPTPPPPTPPPVTIAGALVAPPIVGVCSPLARTDCAFEVCCVGALQGVLISVLGRRGGGAGGGAYVPNVWRVA